MTESGAVASTGVPPQTSVEVEPAGFGPALSRARVRAGLSLQDVAARLRLSVHQVRAIEVESLRELPVAAYVRGFIRSYARIVNLDVEPLLADFNARAAPTAPAVNSMTSPEQSLATDGHSSRRVVMAAGVLVLIALGAIGWYSNVPRTARVAATVSAPAVTQPAPVVAIKSPSETAAPAVPNAAAADAPPVPVSAPVEEPKFGDVPAARDAPTSLVLASVTPPNSVLELALDGPCWVEVKSNGRVIHSQLHEAGGELKLDGPLPMNVVLGDGSNARVWVRGKPFELDSVMRGNIARFTVDP